MSSGAACIGLGGCSDDMGWPCALSWSGVIGAVEASDTVGICMSSICS